MLFNSFTFVAFLAVVLPLYYACSHRWQNRLLLVSSYVFYGWWDWRFLSLLVASTMVDFYAAKGIAASKTDSGRKACLWASILLNLGCLGFFKYFNFFVDSLAAVLQEMGVQANLPVLNVILPVGISFYTFQTMSYTIDVYRGQLKATNDFGGFALYVTYFPQLVAGPIERAAHLLPTLQAPRRVSYPMLASGLQLMLMGYLKKVGIADNLAIYVDKAFSQPSEWSSPALLMSVYLFAIQIYCDFSGYSDIARGVSRLLGIDLMINFRQPYFSANITEFWHRWHISLSTWLRDYVYIPLGGNRLGEWRTYGNLLLTMLLGGLWHGAAWTFVVWGGLHGLYLAVHKLCMGSRKPEPRSRPGSLAEWLAHAVRVVATFHLVCLAWVFFRADSLELAITYLTGIFRNGFSPDYAGRLVVLSFYAVVFVVVDLACWWNDTELPPVERVPAWARGLAYAGIIAIISFVGESQVVPFIYFQF